MDEIEYETEEELEEFEAYTSDINLDDSLQENLAIFLSEATHEVLLPSEKGILTQKQEQKVEELLNEHQDVFTKSISKEGQTSDLGRTNVVTHTIDTGNAKPIKQRPYKSSPDQQEFIKNEITTMLKKGIISPTMSPWSSPVVVVPKKNNKKRLCIDY